MSDRFDIVVDTGSDQVFIFEIVNTGNKEPILTEGYTARMQVRPYIGSKVVADELTTENGRMEFVADGKLKVVMTSEATDAYRFNKGVYDIEIVSPEGTVTRIVEGRVVAHHGVTQ